MSFDMRRRQEGTRKRGYIDSSLGTTDNNSYNPSSKAYAVQDSSYEDLDRLIMFITESKQIQGRYYVRYLPGMMNSTGELTPCNYRPTFSFSPPRSPASSSSTTTTPTSLRINNRSRGSKGSLPDVVDLTDEDEVNSQTRSAKNKGFLAGIRPYSDGRRIDRPINDSSSDNDGKKANDCSDDDDGDDEKGASGSTRTATSGVTNKKQKQTARKSMRPRTEVRPSEIPEIKGSNSKTKNDDDDKDKVDDQEGNSQHNVTEHDDDDDDHKGKVDDQQRNRQQSVTRPDNKDTTRSAADGNPPSENKNKSSNKDSNNISSNNNSTASSSSSSSPSKGNMINNVNNKSLSEDWSILDGITVSVNPDFG